MILGGVEKNQKNQNILRRWKKRGEAEEKGENIFSLAIVYISMSKKNLGLFIEAHTIPEKFYFSLSK